MMILGNMLYADKMDIVDEIMEAGAQEEFKAEWKEIYKPIKKKTEESNMPIEKKDFIQNKLENIGEDKQAVREMVKVIVEVETENMTEEEISEYAFLIKNPIIQKTNTLLINEKIKNKITEKDKEKLKKFTKEIRKRMTEEKYEMYMNQIFSTTNMKAIQNIIKATKNGTLKQRMYEVMINMTIGKRIIIETKKQKYY